MPTSAAVPMAKEIDAAGMLPTALPRPALIGAWSAMKPPANTVARTAIGVLSMRLIAGAQRERWSREHRRSGSSLGCQPIGAIRHIDFQRRVEVEGADHLAAHDLRRLRGLGLRGREQRGRVGSP